MRAFCLLILSLFFIQFFSTNANSQNTNLSQGDILVNASFRITKRQGYVERLPLFLLGSDVLLYKMKRKDYGFLGVGLNIGYLDSSTSITTPIGTGPTSKLRKLFVTPRWLWHVKFGYNALGLYAGAQIRIEATFIEGIPFSQFPDNVHEWSVHPSFVLGFRYLVNKHLSFFAEASLRTPIYVGVSAKF